MGPLRLHSISHFLSKFCCNPELPSSSSTVNISPSAKSRLPDDVLRMIFEEYVWQCNEDASRLFLVSLNAMAWIAPYIYSKAVLRTPAHVNSFIAAVNGELEFSRPARHVQKLWVLCTDDPATRNLRSVLAKCPNLIHIAYDASAPFVVESESDLPPRLSHLSVCSPMRWQDEDYTSGLLIPYARLTHLHFICAGQETYDFVGAHAEDLTALTHLRIDITSPSLAEYVPGEPCFSRMAIKSLVLGMGPPGVRGLFSRIPSLLEIVVKSDFPYPFIEYFRGQVERFYTGVPQITFDFPRADEVPRYELEGDDSYTPPVDCAAAWQRRACRALKEAAQHWS